MDTIALVGALEQVAHSLKLKGFAFGQALELPRMSLLRERPTRRLDRRLPWQVSLPPARASKPPALTAKSIGEQ